MVCTKSKSIEVINKSEPNELIKSAENLTSLKNKKIILEKNNSSNKLMFSYNKDNYYNKTLFKKARNSAKKRMNNFIRKEPFTITTIESESSNIYILKINACSFLIEYLIPIWFDKNTYIKFNTIGKWRIDKNYEFTDSAGMPSSHILNFNYGAAVARIGSGANFLIPPNEFTYYTENEGPLYLKMNLPKKIKVNPEGKMEIKIFDGILMSVEEIYEKIGWKEKIMECDGTNFTELENDLTIEFNNLRMNPILFYEKNIKDNQNKIWTEEFLKQMKKNIDNNGIVPFSISINCHIYLINYIELNYEYIKKNIVKRDVHKFLKDLEEKISLNIKDNFIYDNVISCKIFKKKKSSDICMQYLFDKKFRKYIFNKEYNFIAINISDVFLDDFYLIILVIMKGEKENENNNNN